MQNDAQKIKRCKVCGDVAIGFNWSGLSCGSCKSFYRRNIRSYDQFTCPRENNCLITLSSRKTCTKCRLEKCIKIGMRADLISWNPVCKANTNTLPPSNSFFLKQLLIEIDESLQIQNQNTQPTPPPAPVEPQSQNKTSKPKRNYVLNQYEQFCLEEILRAVSAFQNEDSVPLVADATDLVYILNLSEYYIKQTIKFCKALKPFCCLTEDDQLSVLKTFFTELLIIRLAFYFNSERDGYLAIKDEHRQQAIFIRLEILLGKANKMHHADYIRKYAIEYHNLLEHDTMLRDLLLVKHLFNPKSHTTFPEFLRYQFYVYSRLLERYLQCKHQNYRKAREKLRQINRLLSGIDTVKEIIEEMFIETDASKLAIVLNEVFRE